MQTPSLALHKSHDVVRAQFGPYDRAGPETLLEEIEDEWNVVDDRGPRKATCFPEVFFIPASASFGGGCRACGGRVSGNRAFTPQERQHMLQRRPIASRRLYMPKAIFQIPKRKVGGDAAQHWLSARQPFAESGG